jgi:tubulin polyglutamylase TTLL6/13
MGQRKGSKLTYLLARSGYRHRHLEEEDSDQELKEAQRIYEYNRFRMDPPELNADGTVVEVLQSRLMRKLNKMKHKDPEVHSEDQMVNSFRENFSECSISEEDEDAEKKKLRRRSKKKKPLKGTAAKMMAAGRKARKPIMNVYCTEYDIVKKAAKVFCGFRLRERKEDHEGAIVNGVSGQKLSEEWDVTWHDLGITPDFFSKMLPYQKVNQFTGIYQITKKNNLARNLIKLRKAFPDKFQFFPRTWILPGEASEFRNQFIDRCGRQINQRKTFIVKPDNLA